MPYYDRFDIVDAHYWWNVDHHDGQASVAYARQCRISNYFTPSPLTNGPAEGNSREIYNALCEKARCTHEPEAVKPETTT